MPVLKPTRGMQLNRSCRLIRGLVGCWLFNEGTGKSVFDLSGNGNTGFLNNDVSWTAGRLGPCLYIGGDNDYVDVGDKLPAFGTGDFTILARVRLSSSVADDNPCIVSRGDTGSGEWMFRVYHATTPAEACLSFYGDNGNINLKATGGTYTRDVWHHVAAVRRNGTLTLYQDAISAASGAASSNLSESASEIRLGEAPDWLRCWLGEIDNVMIYNRALSAEEISHLYRSPFCMFDEGPKAGLICTPISYVSLTGSAGAQSSAKGRLTVSCREPEMERFWLRDALFNGMTAGAFKLGTVLSLGWSWFRITGCSALYRGCSMEQIDFDNVLAVAELDAEQISPPGYVPHEPDSIYFYIVRRFNGIGYQGRTFSAAVKVEIDSDGELKEPRPNHIFFTSVQQTESDKVEIVWFYNPLEQKSPPVSFGIYYDNGSGQIDYENPLALIEYQGRRFYRYKSPQLQSERYLFAVRAINADGFKNDSKGQLKIQLNSSNPAPIEIIKAQSKY
jgi:hypothetical protein